MPGLAELLVARGKPDQAKAVRLLVHAGDSAGADLELSAAEATFRGIAAAPLLDECRCLRQQLEP